MGSRTNIFQAIKVMECARKGKTAKDQEAITEHMNTLTPFPPGILCRFFAELAASYLPSPTTYHEFRERIFI